MCAQVSPASATQSTQSRTWSSSVTARAKYAADSSALTPASTTEIRPLRRTMTSSASGSSGMLAQPGCSGRSATAGRSAVSTRSVSGLSRSVITAPLAAS